MSLEDNALKFNEAFSRKISSFDFVCNVVISETQFVLDGSGLHPGTVQNPDLLLSMTEDAFSRLVQDPRSVLSLFATRKISAQPPMVALQVARKLSALV